MAEFEKLIYIDLKVQNQKEYLSIVNGLKLYLFEALYAIQQFYGLHSFFDTIFIILGFIIGVMLGYSVIYLYIRTKKGK